MYAENELKRRLKQDQHKCIRIDLIGDGGPAPFGNRYYCIHEKNIGVKKGESIYFKNIDVDTTSNFPSQLLIYFKPYKRKIDRSKD